MLPPAQEGVGSERDKKMLDERRDNVFWWPHLVPGPYARAIGLTVDGQGRTFYLNLSWILIVNALYCFLLGHAHAPRPDLALRGWLRTSE